MRKILLFGATGMAGHVIYQYLKETGKYDIANVVYRTKLTEDSIVVDVTNRDAVAKVINENRPEVIINCVGVLIKGSEEHPGNAILINAYFPHLLKELADQVGAKLIHISTDCVFSGKKGNYTEDDFRDADDIYGRSKALGEIVNDNVLTIRTSIIGPELKKDGEGLFHWFMNQNGQVNGYLNAYWGGVTTLELAKAISVSLEDSICGLVHLSNGKKISKYHLLCMIKDLWSKKDIIITPFNNKLIDKSISKSNYFLYKVPNYEGMLADLYQWMINREEYRTLYNF